MASIRNSFPIDGSATLIEDMAKGERKAPNVVINRANLLLAALSTLMASVIVILDKMTKSKLSHLNQPRLH
jgi:hypothetical protein